MCYMWLVTVSCNYSHIALYIYVYIYFFNCEIIFAKYSYTLQHKYITTSQLIFNFKFVFNFALEYNIETQSVHKRMSQFQ